MAALFLYAIMVVAGVFLLSGSMPRERRLLIMLIGLVLLCAPVVIGLLV